MGLNPWPSGARRLSLCAWEGRRTRRGGPPGESTPGPRGPQGFTGPMGPAGKDAHADVTALLERLNKTERMVAILASKEKIEGVVFCPVCARPWDIRQDLKVTGTVTRVRFVCTCKADLMLPSEGVEVRRG